MVVTRSQKKTMTDSMKDSSDNGHSNTNGIKEVSPASTSQVEKTPNNETSEEESVETPTITIVLLSIIAAVSYLTLPESLQPVGRPTLQHVWYFGWISALSTGLGVLPLIFSPKLDSWWIGATNGKSCFFFLLCFLELFLFFVYSIAIISEDSKLIHLLCF